MCGRPWPACTKRPTAISRVDCSTRSRQPRRRAAMHADGCRPHCSSSPGSGTRTRPRASSSTCGSTSTLIRSPSSPAWSTSDAGSSTTGGRSTRSFGGDARSALAEADAALARLPGNGNVRFVRAGALDLRRSRRRRGRGRARAGGRASAVGRHHPQLPRQGHDAAARGRRPPAPRLRVSGQPTRCEVVLHGREPGVAVLLLRRVRGVGDHDELGAGDGRGEIVGGAAEAVVVHADEHGGRDVEAGQLIEDRRVGEELLAELGERDRVHLAELRLHARALRVGGFALAEEALDAARRAPPCPACGPSRCPARIMSALSAADPAAVSIRTSDRTRSGCSERVAHRDDAAHRVAEQVEPFEPEVVEEHGHVGDELIERVRRRVAGVRALAVTAVVEGDDLAIAREWFDDVEPVEGAAGEPVDEHQREPLAGAVVGEIDGRGRAERRSSARTVVRSRNDVDELERVDVDEALVGDAQLRDHREAEEREVHERRARR